MREIGEILRLLGIEHLSERPIGRLSGGEQQRVLLARALAHRPQLLVLDEPTVALDPQTREVFYSVLEHLHREHKVTVLLVSQINIFKGHI
jgi:ABC-type Mn2+/Zn2+ transport system ATPase subunit